MNKATTIENILNQVRHLDFADRLNLMERLLRLLKKENIKTHRSSNKLTDLNGLGSEIWTGVNIDQYIQEQRQWD